MKVILKIGLLLTVLSLFTKCESTDRLEFDNANYLENEDVTSSKNELEKTVTMGFNVVVTGTYDYEGPDQAKCGEFDPISNPVINVINNGVGEGTHFGKLTSHFDFCANIIDSSYPVNYGEAYFEDENGDKLFVYVAGTVFVNRVSGMPSYAVSYWKDPFTILGGTGRFEGATGSGMTNDYNSSKDFNSHHHWTGKITLPKRK